MDGIGEIFDIRVISVIIGILIPYLLYRFSIRNFDYWKNAGIPYVKPYPFIGSLLELFRNNSEDCDIKRYKEFGKIYGFYEANSPQIVISDPELLKNILVKDFQVFSSRRSIDLGDPISNKMLQVVHGEDWKRIRAIVSPTFSTGKIKRVMNILTDCAKTVIKNFNESSTKGDPVDVLRMYGAYTMDVIASSAFSTKLDSHNDPENDFVKKAKAVFEAKISLRLILFFLAPGLLKLFKISLFGADSVNFFKKVTLEIIEERRRTGQTRNDFLQLLMDAASEELEEEKPEEKIDDIVANYGDDSDNHTVFKNVTKKHLSMDELVAQCVIFFTAGYESTSTTLGISTYLLALNQDIQDKLYNEIKDVLSSTNGKLTYEAIQEMKYLDCCISESLRLYPFAAKLERTAEVDYKLGDTGITIPKGMIVWISTIAMHRDSKLFSDPERFNPDRFGPEERKKQVPYSYLPFGAGPRNCIAMRFALLEVKVCLAYVLSSFHIQTCSETKIPLEFRNRQGVLQPAPIMLQLTPRLDSPLKTA